MRNERLLRYLAADELRNRNPSCQPVGHEITARRARGSFALALPVPLFVGLLGASAANVTADYRIRFGDVLAVTVFGDPSLTQARLKVLPGGTIVEPLAGQIGGWRPNDRRGALRSAGVAQVRSRPDAAAVAGAIGALLDDVGRANRMGDAGLARAPANFTWGVTVRKIASLTSFTCDSLERPDAMEAYA